MTPLLQNLLFALVGGAIVLIIGAGYKSYSVQDLPSAKEGTITFLAGTALSAVLAFMGGFDAWLSDPFKQRGGSPVEVASEFGSIATQVTDSVKNLQGWFSEAPSVTEDMMVGSPPF